jgi:hypothetical protein
VPTRAQAHVDRRIGLADLTLAVLLIAPLGERVGWIDHWLGWALYAPHSSRARIEITSSAVEKLPQIVQPFVVCDLDSDVLWCEVRIDQWSMSTLAVPVYPQQRFQIAVARGLGTFVGEHEMRVELLSSANRLSGQRKQRLVYGRDGLLDAADRFWFSTRPRFNPSTPQPQYDDSQNDSR